MTGPGDTAEPEPGDTAEPEPGGTGGAGRGGSGMPSGDSPSGADSPSAADSASGSTVAGESASAEGAGEPDGGTDDGVEGGAPRSGLRNPAAAMRGVGAGTLVIEGLVLLLAVLPLRMLGAGGRGMGAVALLALLCLVLTGFLKHRWSWYAGIGVQVLVIAGGVVHWSVAVIGVLFAAIWAYVLHVRRTVLGRI
ncbi:MAG TPA: DUF4233 domain-containing protein [Actinocatenispora sp.]